MNTARRRPLRAFVASLVLIVPLLAAATPASGAVVINEVESQPTDFVELYNTGPGAVDIGGYQIRDDNDGNIFTIPALTNLPVGGFYLANALGFGLGNADQARLFDPGANLLDSYSYADHAPATYGRCPDGTGSITWTISATSGAANDCAGPATPWPGGSAVADADATNVLGGNISGLAYQPSGSSGPGVLWVTKNNPSTLFRMVFNGTEWTPDTTNGWATGKGLRYPGGIGNPDAEGVTLAAGDPNTVYVATERDDDGPNSNTSRPAVLRFDVTAPGGILTATQDWNLTPDLLGLDPNLGLEAVTWIPDAFLVSKGFLDEATGLPYATGTYPDHGTGLFFVGVEQTGQIIAYALNQSNGTFARVATIASGFPGVMALDYEAESTHLWAVCDNGCDGRANTLDIAQSGVDDGKFAITNSYNRPSGMPNLNNEGFTITPQAECVNNLKPVIWADDSNTGTHALRQGTINCTPPSNPPGDGPPADIIPPADTPPETKIDSGPKKKTTKTKAKFTFSANEPATFRCKLDKGDFAPCTSPATFNAKKKGKHTLEVVAVDAAGNADATPASYSWKLKKKKKK